uniref:Uncharacterized protein n=1 Tax=Sphaerodactylus townsendi TaxID=933632 RepID=A0ACB8FCD6_9SAUR
MAVEVSLCSELISLALEGLSYYHTYDRFFLGISVALSFVGWTSYVILVIVKEQGSLIWSAPNRPKPYLRSRALPSSLPLALPSALKLQSAPASSPALLLNLSPSPGLQEEISSLLRYAFPAVGVLIVIFLLVQSLPWTYYIYCLLPVPIWFAVLKDYPVIQALASSLLNVPWAHSVGFLLASTVGIEILVLSFFYQPTLSFALMTFSMWPLVSRLWTQAKTTVLSWILSCLLLSVFPWLPVVGRDQNIPLV